MSTKPERRRPARRANTACSRIAHGEICKVKSVVCNRLTRRPLAGLFATDNLARLDAEHARLWKRCVNKMRR
jgi:hypothetical protein